MEWKRELKNIVVLTFAFIISFHPEQLALAQQPVPVSLTITPVLAIIDDRVRIECSAQLDSKPDSKVMAVFYDLKRDGNLVVKQNVLCATKELIEAGIYRFDDGKVGPLDCTAMVVEGLVAKRDALAGGYTCDVQVQYGLKRMNGVSGTVRLTVGDKTPPVAAFTVVNLADGVQIDDGAEMPAGTNTTVTCSTEAVTPEPAFVVSISGKENRTNLTIGHQVSFHEAVPREPKVVYTCEVFNGFGERQYKQIAITATYGVIPSEVTVPTEATIDTGADLEICRARNNPSQQLQISSLDAQMVQEGYPQFKQEPGLSLAFVRLSSKAAEVKDAKLEYGCGLGDMQPVKASVVLVASNTAMMTAGIVIGAIVAFLLIVAGAAYYLKRRNAEPKPAASDKAGGYGRVNQNDADQGGYNIGGGGGGSSKVTGSNQPVCV